MRLNFQTKDRGKNILPLPKIMVRCVNGKTAAKRRGVALLPNGNYLSYICRLCRRYTARSVLKNCTFLGR